MIKLKSAGAPKHTFKDRLPLLLAFLIPIFIMLIIFAGKGIYPFGDETFLRIDLYHQYAPFHTDLLRRLQSGASLTYAWDIGLGSNYVALAAYYLTSPFNLLLFFLPAGLITEFIGYIAIIKIGLAGFAMAWYLSAKNGSRTLSATFFGICYAMCGYFAAYNWNIMWLDCLWLAPLVILGLERLVKENRPFLYCVTLAVSIITNYYIAIMLCMFLVLYFICLVIMTPMKSAAAFWGKVGQFALFSLIAGGIAACVVVPAYFALTTTASAWAKTTFPTSLTSYFSVFEMLSRHLTLVDCELGLEHWPNIYSGVAVFVFLPMYYMNKRVYYKEKIVKTVLLALLLLSFSLNIPNYIWHGLHYPNSLPCRQSFLYTIILLSMCFEGARGIRQMSRGMLAGIFFGSAAFILIAEKIVDAPEFYYYSFYVSLIFVGLYVLFLYLNRAGRLTDTLAFLLAIIVLVVESGVNMSVTSVTITGRTEYWKNVDSYQRMLDQAGDDSLFYRVDKVSRARKSKNDATFVGYNSASVFSSTAHAGISDIYKKLGMEGNTNAYCLNGSTPFTESLLSVKYKLSNEGLPESPLYTPISVDGEAYLYRNDYTMPIGFLVNDTAEASWTASASSPAKAQNRLCELLGGSDAILSPIPGSAQGTEYTTSVNERAHCFAYIENSSIDAVTATVGGVEKNFSNVKRHYLLDLGYVEAGAGIKLSTDEEQTMNATVYSFNDDEFIKSYSAIQENGIELTEFKSSLMSTYLSGNITSAEGQSILFTIPYENGWSVKVDGNDAEVTSFAGAFILIKLAAGEHHIELSYMPEGLKLGVFVSIGSLAVLIILFAINRIYLHSKRKKKANGGYIEEGGDSDTAETGETHEFQFESMAAGKAESPYIPEDTTPGGESIETPGGESIETPAEAPVLKTPAGAFWTAGSDDSSEETSNTDSVFVNASAVNDVSYGEDSALDSVIVSESVAGVAAGREEYPADGAAEDTSDAGDLPDSEELPADDASDDMAAADDISDEIADDEADADAPFADDASSEAPVDVSDEAEAGDSSAAQTPAAENSSIDDTAVDDEETHETTRALENVLKDLESEKD